MPRHDPSEKTKSEILQTATRLFQEKGWANVNIEDVVKEVGVTRGAFYHYFKSREELIMAVVDKMFIDDNPFTAVSKKTELNALEKLRLMVQLSLDNNLSDIAMAKEVWKALDNPVIFKSEFFSQINTVAPFIEKLLIEGNEDGSMSVQYPKQAAQIIALLPSLWLSPAIFQVPYEEFVEKVAFFKHLMESIGVPVIDDEIMEQAFLKYGKMLL